MKGKPAPALQQEDLYDTTGWKVFAKTYDDSGTLQTTKVFNYGEGHHSVRIVSFYQNQPSYQTELFWDSSGSVLQSRLTNLLTGKVVQEDHYSYDSRHQQVSLISVTEDTLSIHAEISYDEKGRAWRSNYFDRTGAWMSRTSMFYDEAGRVIRNENESQDSTLSVFETSYDAEGKMIKRVAYRSQRKGASWKRKREPEWEAFWTYNPKGLMAESKSYRKGKLISHLQYHYYEQPLDTGLPK